MKGKRILSIFLVGVMIAASCIFIVPKTAGELFAADQIICDGNNADWADIESKGSNDAAVKDWKVCVSQEYLYLYVEQNPTGSYGEAIGNTEVALSYHDSNYFNGNYGRILFAQDWQNGGYYVAKDGYYTNLDGAQVVFADNTTDYNVDAAYAEIAIPRSWFPSEKFTLTYAGISVSSEEIVTINGASVLGATETTNPGYGDGNSSAGEGEDTPLKPGDSEGTEENPDTSGENDPSQVPTYTGIVIDGSFTDWSTIEKTQNPAPELKEGASVWDGDYVYLYLREQDWWNGCASIVGPYNNGNFCIETSDGTKTSVFVTQGGCYAIFHNQWIQLEYNLTNHEYEIQVPTSAIQGFGESTTYLNFGIMTDRTPIYISQGITNRRPDIDYDNSTAGKLKQIQYDYDFSDWEGYQKTTIQYSTAGHSGIDAVGSLYSDGDYLFGYVDYYANFYADAFNYIYLCVNGKNQQTWGGDNDCMKFTLRAVDADGNVQHWNQAVCLAPGDYEYYLFDTAYVGCATNINSPYTFTYGRAYIHVDQTGRAQMEYYIDIPTLVKVVNLTPEQWGAYNWNIKQSDIKTFHVLYVRMGIQWVSCGGTSTGPIVGILLCIGVVIAAQVYRKKRSMRA